MKFGYARATGDAAHEVREGLIDREEAAALVRRYDTEFPKKNFDLFLNYCDFSESQFWEVCEKWRNLNLWNKDSGEWKLNKQVE